MKDFCAEFEAFCKKSRLEGCGCKDMLVLQDCGCVYVPEDLPEDVLERLEGKSPEEMYLDACQVFNLRFQRRPWAIVSPRTTEQVSHLVKFAKAKNIPLRVRGGGHDHEAECIATSALVLDMRLMKRFELEERGEDKIAHVGPGWIFVELVEKLRAASVCIPHGTCQTVGITGFTLGGGWGPWTRKYGMACESLVGAEVVLGDGTVLKLTEECEERELLWALRGGGGFSYGIVTELSLKTFDMPASSFKVTINWKDQAAEKVLKFWQQVIVRNNSPELVGTNLQIFAKPEEDDNGLPSVHECNFFGYVAGDEELSAKSVRTTVSLEWFYGLPVIWESTEGGPPVNAMIEQDQIPGEPPNTRGHLDFSSWARTPASVPPEGDSEEFNLLHYMPLEGDLPAPHKITSRLVNPGERLDKEGRENLIRSLQSDLLFPEGERLGVQAYCTLGAISGPYYYNRDPEKEKEHSAFPYFDRPYTIQYQVWWFTKTISEVTDGLLKRLGVERADQAIPKKVLGRLGIDTRNLQDKIFPPQILIYLGIDRYTNRAMDWIETTRKADFPQTSGAFISFKDDAVPTETYFGESYERLIEAKERYSRDRENRFRSRKTII